MDIEQITDKTVRLLCDQNKPQEKNIPSLSTTSGGKRRVAKALLMMLENSWLKEHQQKLMLNCIFKTGYKKMLLFFHNQASVVETVESAAAIHLIISIQYTCIPQYFIGLLDTAVVLDLMDSAIQLLNSLG